MRRVLLIFLTLALVPTATADARTTVVSSDSQVLKLHVEFPKAAFATREGKYTEMTVDGFAPGVAFGQPGVPVTTPVFAVPRGATVSATVSNVEYYDKTGVLLYPTQLQSGDSTKRPPPETFADPPFQIDRTAYESDRTFPATPAAARSAGTIRDVRAGQVAIAAGAYAPKTKTLRVYTSMDVTIRFGGDNKGVFGPSDMFGKWNHAWADEYGALLNLDAVRKGLDLEKLGFCGEELLIITSPALRAAANRLADQRRAQGYPTSVKEVGSGTGQIGTTNTEIQSSCPVARCSPTASAQICRTRSTARATTCSPTCSSGACRRPT